MNNIVDRFENGKHTVKIVWGLVILLLIVDVFLIMGFAETMEGVFK